MVVLGWWRFLVSCTKLCWWRVMIVHAETESKEEARRNFRERQAWPPVLTTVGPPRMGYSRNHSAVILCGRRGTMEEGILKLSPLAIRRSCPAAHPRLLPACPTVFTGHVLCGSYIAIRLWRKAYSKRNTRMPEGRRREGGAFEKGIPPPRY